MPNWMENKICVKGREKDLVSLLNLALRNSGAAEVVGADGSGDKLQDAIDSISANATFKTGVGDVFTREKKEISFEKGISMSTFLPIPDTFLEYDTENFQGVFPDAEKEQMDTYGVVGWYRYNLKFFGCKWDSPLTDFQSEWVSDDIFILSFATTTPWSQPDGFLTRLDNMFPSLTFYNCCLEEGRMFCGYYEIGGKLCDYTDKFGALYDSDDENVDYDALYDDEEHLAMEMDYDYMKFVRTMA